MRNCTIKCIAKVIIYRLRSASSIIMDLNNFPSVGFNGISLVIPVMNEESNIEDLIRGILEIATSNPSLKIKEIVFVDDGSTDKTKEIVRKYSIKENQIKILLKERFEKMGTVNAQLFGISQASHNNVLIMDGDLQHPVSVLPILIKKYQEGFDFVIASRYVKGGGAERTIKHGIISRGANFFAKFLLPWVSTVKDPISGFFIVNRRIVPTSIEMSGFNKLGLYIMSCKKNISIAEIPFKFKERARGHSKVATGRFDYMIRYFRELKYYRFLRKVVVGRFRPAPGSSEYLLLRQD